MKAVEFETTVNRDGQIALPQDVVGDIPPGGPVRVVRCGMPHPPILRGGKSARRKLEEAYCAADAVYEELVANDAPDR